MNASRETSRIDQPDYRLQYILGAVPDEVWDSVSGKVQRAMDVEGGDTADDVRGMVERGELYMLIVVDQTRMPVAVVFTKIETWNAGRTLYVVACAGQDFDGWIGLVQDTLVQWAKQGQCVSIRATCRPGMAKWLSRIGYTLASQSMEYPIDGR